MRLQGPLAAGQFAVVGPDLVFGILFIVSFFKVEHAREYSTEPGD
jgi:hypothetical protein